jgi:hypothetical protein
MGWMCVAQEEERLPSKYVALSSITSTENKTK